MYICIYVYMYICICIYIYIYIYIYVYKYIYICVCVCVHIHISCYLRMPWNNPCLGLEMHKRAKHRIEDHVGTSEGMRFLGHKPQNVAEWASRHSVPCWLVTIGNGLYSMLLRKKQPSKKVARWGKAKNKTNDGQSKPSQFDRKWGLQPSKIAVFLPTNRKSWPFHDGIQSSVFNWVACPQEWGAVQPNLRKQRQARGGT